ncbi:protein white [Eurytemora carolleeae]|uniref:protein white n=1 Tax=Eurytemora carolleeae TaxID=1294199 RepID=UPI000C78098E|nr:protein white [Eurytemora carolleeae]|eukprot:XP_023321334.1 protein white-like [Eurytemora affinis]
MDNSGFSSEDSFEPEVAGASSSTPEDKLENGENGSGVKYFYKILNENSETMNNDVPRSLGENQFDANKRAEGGNEVKEGVTVCWKNVSVIAKGKKNGVHDVKLLDNVSGFALPGEFLAIMGSSGAGKTTLLNTLTHRNQQDVQIEGSWTANGHHVTPQMMTGISGYVHQDELFIGSLTIREHLMFQAMVGMDGNISLAEKMKRVDQVLQELGLKKSENTVIGIPGRIKGISGGEKRRLAVACEVLSNPPILFCDEPTSGLDSFMANSVIESLVNLARQGRTVVCTIHQPSSQIYTKFDRLLLMAKGKTAFHGNPASAVEFFTRCGFPCPWNYNPADHFLDVLAVHHKRELLAEKDINKICSAFEECTEYLNSLNIMIAMEPSEFQEEQSVYQEPNLYQATWFMQLIALLWRNTLIFKRDPKLFTAKILQTLLVALMFGAIYYDQKLDKFGIMNINGALFVSVINLSFMNLYPIMTIFSTEIPVFLREHHNGLYRVDTYFIAKQVVMFPLFVIQPVLFMSILYWLAGLHPDLNRFFSSIYITILLTQDVVGVGYLMSCAFRLDIALSLTSLFTTPLMLVGGFYLNTGSIPIYLRWLKYLSWYYYAFEALMINQWQGVENISCNGTDLTWLSAEPMSYLLNLNKTKAMDPHNCMDTGEKVLEFFSFPEENFRFDIIYMTLLMVFIRGLAFVALWSNTYRRKQKK